MFLYAIKSHKAQKIELVKNKLSPDQCQALVCGYIEIVHLPGGEQLIVNEDGISLELPANDIASKISGKFVVGNAIHLPVEFALD